MTEKSDSDEVEFKPLSPVYICKDSKYCPPPPTPYRRPAPYYRSRLPKPPQSSQETARKKYSFKVLTPPQPKTGGDTAQKQFETIYRKDLKSGNSSR